MVNFSPYILGRRWFTWDRQCRCRVRRPSHSGMGWHILSLPWGRRRIGSTWPVSTRSCGGQASAKSGRRSHVGNPSGLEKGIACKQSIQFHFYPVCVRAGEIPKKIHNTLSKWSLYLVMAMQTDKSENKSWQAVSVWISIFLRGTSTV